MEKLVKISLLLSLASRELAGHLAGIDAEANDPFLRYMQQDIFLPLGMNQTVANPDDDLAVAMAANKIANFFTSTKP